MDACSTVYFSPFFFFFLSLFALYHLGFSFLFLLCFCFGCMFTFTFIGVQAAFPSSFSFLKTKIKTVFGSASYTSLLYCLPNTFIACLPALSLLCCAHFLAFSCIAQTNDDLTLSCPALPCLTTLKTHPYSRACRRRYTEYEVPRYHIYFPL